MAYAIMVPLMITAHAALARADAANEAARGRVDIRTLGSYAREPACAVPDRVA
jgi:hypothetical protein